MRSRRRCSLAICSSSSASRSRRCGDWSVLQQFLVFRLERAQPLAAGGGQGAPAHGGLAHGTHDVHLGGNAVADDAAVAEMETAGAFQLALDQVGQLQVLEQKIQEFPGIDLEGELILAFAAVAGFLAAATALAAGGLLDAVPLLEFLVARVHHVAAAAAAVVEDRLGEVLLRDGDALALFHVLDRAPAHGVVHRLADVAPVAVQEALPVHRALVLAIQAPVDDVAHGFLRKQLQVESYKLKRRLRFGRGAGARR